MSLKRLYEVVPVAVSADEDQATVEDEVVLVVASVDWDQVTVSSVCALAFSVLARVLAALCTLTTQKDSTDDR